MPPTRDTSGPGRPSDDVGSESTAARSSRREHSRRRILDAAFAALNSDDGERVTVREIAARAEVSAGLVMRHFPTMADLVLEVFLEANADLDADLTAAAAGSASARDRVIAAFRWLTERDLSRANLAGRTMAHAWTWSEVQEERLVESIAILKNWLERALEDHAGPTPAKARQAAAVALTAIFNNCLRRAVTGRLGVDKALALMTPCFDIVLDGLAANAEPQAGSSSCGANRPRARKETPDGDSQA